MMGGALAFTGSTEGSVLHMFDHLKKSASLTFISDHPMIHSHFLIISVNIQMCFNPSPPQNKYTKRIKELCLCSHFQASSFAYFPSNLPEALAIAVSDLPASPPIHFLSYLVLELVLHSQTQKCCGDGAKDNLYFADWMATLSCSF